MRPASKNAAQQRADEIRVFRREFGRVAADGALALTAQQQQALDAYHDGLLAELASAFDIDRDARSSRLSWGMRIASLLGALALAASVYFLFHRFWGLFPEAAQVAILLSASLSSFGATMWLRQRDESGYFTKLAAMIAFVCFVLNIVMLGQIYNIAPSDKALLLWAAYALLLAYACDLRLLLAAGLCCIVAFVAARVGTWSGVYWLHFGERPENFLPISLLLYCLPLFVPHPRRDLFPPVYRLFGLLTLLLPVLILSHWGAASYLDWPVSTVEAFYQVAGFVLSAAAVWLGLRRLWAESVNGGVVFFVIFLYTKFFDWWWELMPKYLFFLVVGLASLLLLSVMQRLRRAYRPLPEESP